MRKFLKEIIVLFYELVFLYRKNKRVRKSLHQYVDMLTNGIYKINNSQTQVYEERYARYASIEDRYQYGSIKVNNTNKPLIVSLLTHLLCKKSFKVQTDKKYFQGQLLCTTTMYGNVKVFDFENSKLVSIYNDDSFFNHLVENRNYWDNYFDVPNYVVKKDKYNIIEEEILNKEEFCSSDVLPLIIDDYIRYFSRIDFSKEINVDYDKVNEFCQLININEGDFLSYINSSEYRECIVHGDLWRSNIIYTGGKKYYIDFENVGKRVFYYDILFFIYMDWSLGDATLMQKYCNGELDDILSRLYSSINVNYDPSKKKIMLITFLYFFYLEFWQEKQNVDNKIIELIQNY